MSPNEPHLIPSYVWPCASAASSIKNKELSLQNCFISKILFLSGVFS